MCTVLVSWLMAPRGLVVARRCRCRPRLCLSLALSSVKPGGVLLSWPRRGNRSCLDEVVFRLGAIFPRRTLFGLLDASSFNWPSALVHVG